MSWLEKILPPKIRKTDTAARHQIPEGLWLKCPSCSTVLYKTDLLANFTGFSLLEQGDGHRKEPMSGEEAFTTAYFALKKILD